MRAAWQFWIDVGGTFTDCLARHRDGPLQERKVLSSGALRCRVAERAGSELTVVGLESYPDGFFRGYAARALGGGEQGVTVRGFRGGRRLELATDAIEAGADLELTAGEPAPILAIRAVLGVGLDSEIGEVEVRLGTTRATNALLERRGAPTGFVTTAGFADILAIGDQTRPRLFALDIQKPVPLHRWTLEVDERTAADGTLLRQPDADAARAGLRRLREQGAEALAI
ncbi:MAG: hydantoinase/oxoprolinase N-terminal domain-containing protein, partial [Thermoanaerobaculia bacterium]|nr:hydantoinase/oxoprolinase N-terminal domain-containing protein [Thermoanaerobaculia bacterium]